MTAISPVVATNRDHLRSLVRQEIARNSNACSLNHIDVSAITTFEMLFREFHDFNGDISRWNVSKVDAMAGMFAESQFIGDISNECGILEQRLHVRDVGYIDEIQIHGVTMRRHCRIDQLFEMIAITGNDGVGCTHRIIVP